MVEQLEVSLRVYVDVAVPGIIRSLIGSRVGSTDPVLILC